MAQRAAARCFDALRDVDLQEVYEQSKQEVLREYAFRIELDHADTVDKLAALVFDEAAGLERWTCAGIVGISNRFRLLSAPEYEIRLYEASQNGDFRAIPRAREFYLLALNKVGRATKAIAACQQLIAKGGENGLVWGTLGDAYSLKMLSAEQFEAALNEPYRALAVAEPPSPEAVFLKRTMNFRALTSNLVPQYIQGGIGRVGTRVPDLTINRHVQEDLRALIEEEVLSVLSHAERAQPKAVIAVIQRLIGTWLGLAELQDLQSPALHAFDMRSDGLILLSGIDPAMRQGSRSTTDLTAALLRRTGDRRETMYLNGALFAYYQQMQVYEKLAAAMACLSRGDQEALHRIIAEEIPAILRYEIRGGRVAVYVDSIAMQRKYYAERVAPDDPTAIERPYDVEAFLAGRPLTRYELENAKLRLTFTNGTTSTIEPRDPVNGKWRPIAHIPVPDGGGIPRIPEHGADGSTLATIQLLNLVEEHTLSFLYDGDTAEVELCDGLDNEGLFDSPYQFGSGRLAIDDFLAHQGLIRAGTRRVRGADGQVKDRQTFIEFLPFSMADDALSLGEGDLAMAFQLMGRLFAGKLVEERRRLEHGTSPIPAILEKVSAWQLQQREATQRTPLLDQRLAKVLLDLARDRPELVGLQDVRGDHELITQGQESDSVYLVLSGQLKVYQDGRPL